MGAVRVLHGLAELGKTCKSPTVTRVSTPFQLASVCMGFQTFGVGLVTTESPEINLLIRRENTMGSIVQFLVPSRMTSATVFFR